MAVAELDQSDSNISSMRKLRNGYYTVKVKSHYYEISRHRMRLHRYLWETANKACLLRDVDVHHADGDKSNNNIENLQPLRSVEHSSLHARKKLNYIPYEEWRRSRRMAVITKYDSAGNYLTLETLENECCDIQFPSWWTQSVQSPAIPWY